MHPTNYHLYYNYNLKEDVKIDYKVIVSDTINYYELDVKVKNKKALSKIINTMLQDFFKEYNVVARNVKVREI